MSSRTPSFTTSGNARRSFGQAEAVAELHFDGNDIFVRDLPTPFPGGRLEVQHVEWFAGLDEQVFRFAGVETDAPDPANPFWVSRALGLQQRVTWETPMGAEDRFAFEARDQPWQATWDDRFLCDDPPRGAPFVRFAGAGRASRTGGGLHGEDHRIGSAISSVRGSSESRSGSMWILVCVRRIECGGAAGGVRRPGQCGGARGPDPLQRSLPRQAECRSRCCLPLDPVRLEDIS